MDTRTTFNTAEELLSILSSIYEQKQQASLLIDSNGLTRVHGKIISISKKEDTSETVIHLSEHGPIEAKDIIGINGIFHADYSEC
jgi:hypothetical protein